MSGAAGASEEAREYLRKQSRLADLQMENVRLQNENLQKLGEFEVSHLGWRRFNDQMRGAMQIVLVVIGAAVVIAIGAAVWNASQAEGLVVDSFSVPPQFAHAGMGGDVAAADLMQRIATVRDTANAHSIAHSKDVRLGREALILENRSDLAFAKFAEAAKYAPDWGRLHLKWGEALAYLGRTGDAEAQFALADGLDLSPADKSTLRKWMAARD